MLKIAQDYAVQKLKQSKVKFKILETYTENNRRMSDIILVKKLPDILKNKGFYLSVRPNKKKYFQLYQPAILYTKGQLYGFTPQGFLQD